MKHTCPTLAAYTADVEAARNAYAADMAVQNGLCAACQAKPKDGHSRRCWSCRRAKITEAAK